MESTGTMTVGIALALADAVDMKLFFLIQLPPSCVKTLLLGLRAFFALRIGA